LKGHTFIIGAGVAGLSVAFELARRAHAVTVLDRGGIGAESSWAGAGILSPLPPWAYAGAVHELAQAGIETWPAWVGALAHYAPTDPEYWDCGMAVLDEPNQPLAIQWSKEHKLRCERGEYAPDALTAALKSRALWLPDVAQVRNPRLIRALTEAVESQGGEVLAHTPVSGLIAREGRIEAIRTPQGELSGDQVVLATGAWGAMDLGPIPGLGTIRPVRGQMLLFAPGSHRLATILLRRGLYLVPRLDGSLLVGSTLEDAGFDSGTVPKVLKHLHQSACEMIPGLRNHQPIKSWAGLRPGSPDNIPLIGRHPDFENLWLNLGHYRYGVTMSPASATLLTDLMEGRKPAIDPTPYSWLAFKQRAWTATNLPGHA
jgi:glycine oxidase